MNESRRPGAGTGAAASIEGAVSRWVRPEIRQLTPYHVPQAEGLIKLDAMENPFGWPPEMEQAWLERLRSVPLNRYPSPAANALKQRIRITMQIPEAMAVMLGNGSDELIQIIQMTVGGAGRAVLAPVPTFVMYEMISIATGCGFVGVPLSSDYSLNREAMLTAIARHRPAVVFLAYPNNPTGNLFDRTTIDAILDACEGIVVLDEAYHPFAGDTYMGELEHRGNLLVMRTLSKLGLAGLRLGVLVGPPAWLEQLEKVRLPYNVNSLTQATAEYAFEHDEVFANQARLIRSERKRVTEALATIDGLTAYPSAANFVMFRCRRATAEQVFQGLLERGILIKNLHRAGTPLAGCLRVTIGTPQENDAFLEALKRVLAE